MWHLPKLKLLRRTSGPHNHWVSAAWTPCGCRRATGVAAGGGGGGCALLSQSMSSLLLCWDAEEESDAAPARSRKVLGSGKAALQSSGAAVKPERSDWRRPGREQQNRAAAAQRPRIEWRRGHDFLLLCLLTECHSSLWQWIKPTASCVHFNNTGGFIQWLEIFTGWLTADIELQS